MAEVPHISTALLATVSKPNGACAGRRPRLRGSLCAPGYAKLAQRTVWWAAREAGKWERRLGRWRRWRRRARRGYL